MNTKKILSIIGAIGVIVSLFVGLKAIDSTYAKSKELVVLEKNVEKNTNSKLLLVEAQAIQTYQGMQLQQKSINKATVIQLYQIRKEFLDIERDRLKRQLRYYPNDQELKDNLEYNKLQRISIQEKIDAKLLEK